MSGKLIALPKPEPLPADFPAKMRRLADDMEAGLVTSVVVAVVQEGEYRIFRPSSAVDTLVLATLLHNRAVELFKPGG